MGITWKVIECQNKPLKSANCAPTFSSIYLPEEHVWHVCSIPGTGCSRAAQGTPADEKRNTQMVTAWSIRLRPYRERGQRSVLWEAKGNRHQFYLDKVRGGIKMETPSLPWKTISRWSGRWGAPGRGIRWGKSAWMWSTWGENLAALRCHCTVGWKRGKIER